jgi:hypothetical protein
MPWCASRAAPAGADPAGRYRGRVPGPAAGSPGLPAQRRAQRTDAELDMLIDVLQQWYALIESRLADAGEAL